MSLLDQKKKNIYTTKKFTELNTEGMDLPESLSQNKTFYRWKENKSFTKLIYPVKFFYNVIMNSELRNPVTACFDFLPCVGGLLIKLDNENEVTETQSLVNS